MEPGRVAQVSTSSQTPEQAKAAFDEIFGEDPHNLTKLHPDLQPFVREVNGFTMLHHPLVVELLPTWKPANEKYAHKQRRLAEALKDGDWHTVIYLHERPYRLEALRTYWREKAIDLPTFRVLLPDVWSDAEPNDTDPRYLTMWRQASKGHGIVYSDPDLHLDQPEVIYRGGGKIDEKLGIAWTTDWNIARFFAMRYRDIGVIWTATCRIEDVLGFVQDRSESEVIIDPAKVQIVNTETVLARSPSSGVADTWVKVVKGLNETP